MKPIFLLAAVFLATAAALAEPPPNLTYTAKEVGWEAKVPAGWRQMTAEEKTKLTETGQKAIGESGTTIDTSKLKELLNLRKDQINSFLSTAEPFDEKANGSYEDSQKQVTQVILDAYKGAGIKIGKVTHSKAAVDGLEFITFEVSLLHPKSGDVFLTQKMFSRKVNGYDFAMTLTTNNEADRKVLEQLIATSKFSIRK